jgi:predicted Zn finger-like uncharacterized protein
MILTQCPSCRTLFRVEGEALEVCGGAVRCGECGAVFQADVYRLDEAAGETASSTRRRRWPFAVAAGLLAAGLAVQALYAARQPLARIAMTRPVIHVVCRALACGLAHPAAPGRFRLLAPEVRLIGASHVLRIRARLENTADFRQTVPHLAVTLLDARGARIARAGFPASTFLHHPRPALGPGGQARVRLTLRIPAQAAGYKLTLFSTGKR